MVKVRAAALANYVQVAESVGLDPDRMLARVGFTRAMLEDPDRPIDGLAIALLLEDSARESGCMGFGLLMAEARPLSGLGAVSLLVRNQRTVRGALQVLIRYQQVLGETLLIDLYESGESAMIRADIISQQPMTRQPVELTVGELCLLLVGISGGAWHPESVHFTHGAPDDLRIHRRIFACPLQFESGINGLSCSAALLDLPVPGAEPELARYALSSVEMLTSGSEGAITARVRRALYLLLPTGRATLDRVGADLGLHPRAVQRLLADEGASFGTVLNTVRRELALRHLATPTHSIEAVAVLVGYATLSSFSRWFGAEFGMSATEWRTGVRSEPGGASPRTS